MKILTYTPKVNLTIVEHENRMRKICQGIVEKHVASFSQYGCRLELELFWHNFIHNTTSNQRLPFQNGYGCYIYCSVKRNEQVVRYKDENGEVDYYELADSWPLSSITRNWLQLRATLFCDLGDVEETINSYLVSLKDLR